MGVASFKDPADCRAHAVEGWLSRSGRCLWRSAIFTSLLRRWIRHDDRHEGGRSDGTEREEYDRCGPRSRPCAWSGTSED